MILNNTLKLLNVDLVIIDVAILPQRFMLFLLWNSRKIQENDIAGHTVAHYEDIFVYSSPCLFKPEHTDKS